jgi:hypothetical protein
MPLGNLWELGLRKSLVRAWQSAEGRFSVGDTAQRAIDRSFPLFSTARVARASHSATKPARQGKTQHAHWSSELQPQAGVPELRIAKKQASGHRTDCPDVGVLWLFIR